MVCLSVFLPPWLLIAVDEKVLQAINSEREKSSGNLIVRLSRLLDIITLSVAV